METIIAKHNMWKIACMALCATLLATLALVCLPASAMAASSSEACEEHTWDSGTKGSSYSIHGGYKSKVEVTYTCTVCGKTKTKEKTMVDLSNVDFDLKTTYFAVGTGKVPSKIKYTKKARKQLSGLKEGIDYKIVYYKFKNSNKRCKKSKIKGLGKYRIQLRALSSSMKCIGSTGRPFFAIGPGKVKVKGISSKTSGSVTLAWKKQKHAAYYYVCYRVKGTKRWYQGVETTSTSATLTGLKSGKKYEVQIAPVWHPAKDTDYLSPGTTKTIKVK